MPERKKFFTEKELSKLVAKYAGEDGLTMSEILKIFHGHGIRLSEATFLGGHRSPHQST